MSYTSDARPRTVFFGTPAIAVPALEALHEVTRVVGVVTQPDRPAGRGLGLRPPAVKVRAEELGLPVYQPVKVRTGKLDEWLKERAVDAAVVLAYGRILPAAVLAAPTHGCLNLHASLLPRYRGAAPINWCIVEGETETGVALMQMDEGLDTGPVFTARKTDIPPTMNAGALAHRIAELASEVVRNDLLPALRGDLTAVPQDHDAATHAPPIDKGHTRVDWHQPALRVANLVRGMAPRPGAHTRKGKKGLRLHRVAVTDERVPGPAGRVAVVGRRILVAAGAADDGRHGALEVLEAQLEGRKALGAEDLVNGRAVVDGDTLE